MPYDPVMIQPFRDELTRAGFSELKTAAEVDAALSAPGTSLVVLNSVCGCAAGQARPGVVKALQHPVRPDRLVSVFAGQDLEATARARSYFEGYAPSSPNIALVRDGKVVFMLQRFHIQSMDRDQIASTVANALDKVLLEGVSASAPNSLPGLA